ncbi:MAG: cation transporter [Deltaproteobacteria bacterium CG11_big_fil_rev_8_21_14_0_20_45_16]|nr:MAG: cation transporter [Deltaproteobacteria bacterium CG11_big_fil_rev_8_21_14_0_20_45_16]
MENNCLINHKPSPHDHPEHPHGPTRDVAIKRLKIAFFIGLFMLVVEIIGAYYSNSLALLADATHLLADASALGITLIAAWMAGRLASPKRSYGYYRLEVLAALANGVLLSLMAITIAFEAFDRIFSEHQVEPKSMMAVGIIGLIGNIAMLFIVAPSHKHNINVKGAFLHIIGDTLSSFAVIVGAAFILLTNLNWPDVVASFFVSTMIIIMAIRLIRESINILLEGTPKHMDPDDIQKNIFQNFPSIKDIHDFHVWEITSNLFAMTAHIEAEVRDLEETSKLIDSLNQFIRVQYGIGHTTFQVEPRTDLTEADKAPSTH